MKLRVLGCSGAEQPGHRLSAFLLDDTLLLDAGTVSAVLSDEQQWRITDILVSHPHLDHVCGIPLMADNLIAGKTPRQVAVASSAEVLAALKTHLMNDVIWPDFTRLPSPEAPVIRYREVIPETLFHLGELGEYSVIAYPVPHTVPAVAYRITRGASTLLYTGDTGPTERIWQAAGKLSALVVEVSFPSDQEELALKTCHLTPRLLAAELAKLAVLPPRILITHLKPSHRDQIEAELDALEIPGLELLEDGKEYRF